MVCYRWWKRSAVLAAALAVTACAGSPIKVAQTVEQKAYAAYGTYVITSEHAAQLTAPSSTVSAPVKVQIIRAAQASQPIVDSMLKGFQAYQQARADFDAKKIDEPALTVSVNSLNSWVTQATAVIANLVTAVRGAQK